MKGVVVEGGSGSWSGSAFVPILSRVLVLTHGLCWFLLLSLVKYKKSCPFR